MKKQLVIGTLVSLLLVSAGVGSNALAFFDDFLDFGGSLQFEPGQMFSYTMEINEAGTIKTGDVSIWAVVTDQGQLELRLAGDGMDGESFRTLARGELGQPEHIADNVGHALRHDTEGDTREIIQYLFSAAWMFLPLHTEELYVGREEYAETPYGTEMFISVPEERTYGDVEGYVVRLGEEPGHYLLEVCIDPELPLPLMASMGEIAEDEQGTQGHFVQIQLVEYQASAAAPEIEVPRWMLHRQELENILDHLRASGLDVGSYHDMWYDMVGAADGISAEIEGEQVELYIFDPDRADPDIIDSLVEARSSGRFRSAAMHMEMDVVVNEFLMITGLQYGTVYTHPAKDKLVEAFLSYQGR